MFFAFVAIGEAPLVTGLARAGQGMKGHIPWGRNKSKMRPLTEISGTITSNDKDMAM